MAIGFGYARLGGVSGGGPPAPIKVGVDYTTQVYGRTIQLSSGRRAFEGVPIWASPIRSTTRNDGYTYAGGFAYQTTTIEKSRDFAVAFGYHIAPEAEHGEVGLLRLWADGNLIWDAGDPTAQSPDVSFTVYTGIAAQEADAKMKEDLGDLTPAFKSMIYIVFNNWKLKSTITPSGLIAPVYQFNYTLPVIRAEFVDGLTFATSSTEFTHLSASSFVSPNGTTVDWDADELYAFHGYTTSSAVLKKFSISAKAELASLPITGGGPYGDIMGVDWCVLLDRQNKMLITTLDGVTNTGEIAAIRVSDGDISADTFGAAGSSTVPTATSIPWSTCGDIAYIADGGGAIPVACLGSIFEDFTPLRYSVVDGVVTWPTSISEGDATQTPGAGTIRFTAGGDLLCVTALPLIPKETTGPLGNQDGCCLLGVGQRLYAVYFGLRDGNMKIIGTYEIEDFGANHIVANVIYDPTDKHIIAIVKNNTTVVWTATKFYVHYNSQSFGGTPGGIGGGTPGIMAGETFRGVSPVFNAPRYTPPSAFVQTDPVLYTVTLPGFNTGTAFLNATRSSDLRHGTLGFDNGADVVVFKLSNGSLYEIALSDSITQDTLWDSSTNTIYYPFGATSNRRLKYASINAAEGDAQTIGDYLRWLALLMGYEDADITVDPQLTDEVIGMVIDHVYNGPDLFTQLGRLYDFQYYESEGKIKFTRAARGEGGAAPVYDLTIDDIANVSENSLSENDSLVTLMTSPSSQVASVLIQYMDFDKDYTWSTQTYSNDRETSDTPATAQDQISVPVVMTTSEAFRRATQLSIQSTADFVSQYFRLPQKYMRLEPADVVSITLPPYRYNIRIDEVTFNGDWSISLSGLNYSFDNNVRVQDSDNLGYVDDSHGYGLGDSRPIVLDMPLIDPLYDAGATKFVVQIGVASYGQTNFTEAIVNFGLPEVQGDTVLHTEVSTVYGRTIGTLPTTSTPFTTDNDTELTIAIQSGDSSMLSSAASYEDFVSGVNMVVIGAPGRWELLFFQNVEVVNDKVVKLTGLLRGRRGTDVYTDVHVDADEVIFIQNVDADFEGGTYQQIVSVAGFNDTEVDYLAIGQPHRRPILINRLTLEAKSLWPWAPVQPAAELDVGDDINLTWVRRDRLDGDLFVEDPLRLSEESEEYELEIMDGDTVVRTVAGLTSPSYTYTSANQTTDGFTPPLSTLKVRIYQISAVVGRGFPREVTLDVV